jgi:predicted metal-dependent hydrolase
MWMWHAAEECEHRSVAFDLYRALGGNDAWRRRWFWIASAIFVADVTRQTVNNLWHDGTLWRGSIWAGGWRFVFGAGGLARTSFAPWRAYLRRDFHPAQLGGSRGAQWLREHAADWVAVGR